MRKSRSFASLRMTRLREAKACAGGGIWAKIRDGAVAGGDGGHYRPM